MKRRSHWRDSGFYAIGPARQLLDLAPCIGAPGIRDPFVELDMTSGNDALHGWDIIKPSVTLQAGAQLLLCLLLRSVGYFLSLACK